VWPPAAAGTYSGLFYPANGASQASSGYFTATLASAGAGAFSAHLLLDGGSYALTGQFDGSGNVQSIVPRTGQPPVAAALHLNLDPPDGRMTGVISSAEWSAVLQAGRAVFNAASNPAPVYGGPMALVIPFGTNTPVGYLTISNTPGGTALVAGRLADGAIILRAAPMNQGPAIPLYAPLYSGKGSFLGWITLTNSTPSANLGRALWLKPDGAKTTGVFIVK
jgi:hypothetical protein